MRIMGFYSTQSSPNLLGSCSKTGNAGPPSPFDWSVPIKNRQFHLLNHNLSGDEPKTLISTVKKAIIPCFMLIFTPSMDLLLESAHVPRS